MNRSVIVCVCSAVDRSIGVSQGDLWIGVLLLLWVVLWVGAELLVRVELWIGVLLFVWVGAVGRSRVCQGEAVDRIDAICVDVLWVG